MILNMYAGTSAGEELDTLTGYRWKAIDDGSPAVTLSPLKPTKITFSSPGSYYVVAFDPGGYVDYTDATVTAGDGVSVSELQFDNTLNQNGGQHKYIRVKVHAAGGYIVIGSHPSPAAYANLHLIMFYPGTQSTPYVEVQS